jgi:hypothetical protein
VTRATDRSAAHGSGGRQCRAGVVRRRDGALQAGGERGAGGRRYEAFCARVQQRVGVGIGTLGEAAIEVPVFPCGAHSHPKTLHAVVVEITAS